MSHNAHSKHPYGPEDWLALVGDPERVEDAAALRNHRVGCRTCERLHQDALAIQREARALEGTSVSDVTRARLWHSLSPHAEAAARRVRRRQAWDTLTVGPRVRRWVAVLLVLGVGAALGAVWSARRTTSAPTPRLAVLGSRAALRAGTRARRTAAPRGPGSVLSARGWPPLASLGPAGGAAATRSRTSRRGSLRRDRPPRERPQAVERRLRCGGVVAYAAARVRITRDDVRGAILHLDQGAVGVRVPHLPAGGRLEVLTPDARVQVKGTRFRVRRVGPGHTAVSVTRGTVWVTPTGRHRRTLVLTAGMRATVRGEAATLHDLTEELADALQAGRLTEVVRLGRRYLEVTSHPERASDIRLRMAGALARLRDTSAAVAIYRRVAQRAPQPVARQNALALLARLYERHGQADRAQPVWQALADGFPGGLYHRTALQRLVRHTCRSTTRNAARWRRRLAPFARTHGPSRALLERCAPQEAPHGR